VPRAHGRHPVLWSPVVVSVCARVRSLSFLRPRCRLRFLAFALNFSQGGDPPPRPVRTVPGKQEQSMSSFDVPPENEEEELSIESGETEEAEEE
jgi:hypothetical protein